MLLLARLSIQRPRLSLAVWAAVAVALALIGAGVSKSLSPSVVVVPGSESSRAQHLAEAHFGPTQLVPILLRGPAAQLDKQGPRLVRDLVKRPHTRALSAWDKGAASEELRPSRTAAMIVLSVDKPERDVVDYDQPQIEALVARDVHAPVRASVTGQPSIDRALKDQALSATRRSELIAIAILFVLLLAGLRAPLAAAAVTLVGVATVFAGYGVMALVGKLADVDPLAVALASMSGLALGVGYSLLVLDRFHRLVAAGQAGAASGGGEAGPGGGGAGFGAREAALNATAAVASAGRAVLIAGGGLILALLLAVAIAPTKILASLGVGVLLCSMLAVGGAVVVMPAALALLGPHMAKAAVAAPRSLSGAWERLVGAGTWVQRNAPIAGLLATLALLLVAVPTLALKTGPPDVSQLPKGDKARVAFEDVARAMGPGWPTPYNVIVAARRGPITTASTLAKLDRFQEQLARDPAVASVAGPGQVSRQTKALGKFPSTVAQSKDLLTTGKRNLGKLVAGLGQAGAGAQLMRQELARAASGAQLLHGGSSEAHAGSAKLRAGLAAARVGSAKLSAGLSQALGGATALKNGATEALAGSVDIVNGLRTTHQPVSSGVPSTRQLSSLAASTSGTIERLHGQAQSASAQVSSALDALRSMTSGKSDPRYGEALAALERAGSDSGGVAGGLGGAAGPAGEAAKIASTLSLQQEFVDSALKGLVAGAAKLQNGLARLRSGNVALASGIGQLSAGGGQLTSGLTKLRDGAGALQAGLGELSGGTGQLQAGLASGIPETGRLAGGLGLIQREVAKFRTTLPSPKDLEQLGEQSPGLFSSGYFLLAAVEGAQPASSNEASFAVNVTKGGNAGQIVVVSRYPAADSRTAALGERLDAAARRFAKQNRLATAVGGPAGNLQDFTSTTNKRLPLVILALAVALALVLAAGLRALALPVIGVLALLLTAAATFGVMQLLFGGAHPPLGGPGYLDPMSIVGIFAVVFGVSLVYLVALLARAREEVAAGARARPALDTALRDTAAASTGSGLLMIAAFIPFATTGLGTVRAFGVAVAVAVAIDTFVVRPVLLPAAVALLGRYSWWPTRVQGEPFKAKAIVRKTHVRSA